MKTKILFAILTVWLILWANFIARDLYKRGYLEDYITLARSNTEEKHSFTYGRHFYEFIKFAKETMPKNTHYDFKGLNEFSISSRRAIYFLYPFLRKKNANYILVYDVGK